jgi:hypothetical protein
MRECTAEQMSLLVAGSEGLLYPGECREDSSIDAIAPDGGATGNAFHVVRLGLFPMGISRWGIGKITGAIVSVIGEVNESADEHRLASYFGIVLRVSNS